MKKSLLIAIIGVLACGLCSADVIQLKSGQEIHGNIIKTTEIGIEIYLEKEQTTKFFMLTNIKSINSVAAEKVYSDMNPLRKELFFSPPAGINETRPMETLRLKSGDELKGVILTRNPYYLRIQLEGQGAIREVLVDQIVSSPPRQDEADSAHLAGIEEKSGSSVFTSGTDKASLIANSENAKHLNEKERAAYRQSFGSSLADAKKVPEKKSILSKAKKIYDLADRDNPKTELEIGSEYSWIKYEEPDLMYEKGNMWGAYGIFTYRLKDNSNIVSLPEAIKDEGKYNVFRLDGRLSWGKVDYDSQGTGTMNDIDDFMYEIRTLFGYEYPATKNLKLTPYLGLGYRYLKDNFAGTTSAGNWGYDRESRYYYMPIGFETRVNLKKSWSIGVTLEYDYFIDGEQKSYLGNGGLRIQSATTGLWYAYDTLVNDQDEGYGLKGSLKVMKRTRFVDFCIEPFIRYWKIKESDPKQYTSEGGTRLWYLDSGLTIPAEGIEPDNNSLEYGIRLGTHF